jgi:uncharacterized protein
VDPAISSALHGLFIIFERHWLRKDMDTKTNLKKITDIIRSECAEQFVEVRNLILFGSRADGTERDDSDWDFLVIINKTLSRSEKLALWLKLDRGLVRNGCVADIIIKDEAEYFRDRDDLGKVTYYAEKSGIAV